MVRGGGAVGGIAWSVGDDVQVTDPLFTTIFLF